MHHEVELVVKIDRLGKTISEAHASRYYSEVGLGIDFTARDVQSRLKERGHPWERAKAFDGSAVVGGFVSLGATGKGHPIAAIFPPQSRCKVVQEGNTSDMLFSVDRLISEVSKFMTLKVGDLLFTGTPSRGCGCEIRRSGLWVGWKVTTFLQSTSNNQACICHLIGFMGSGKSTVGEYLANQLGRPFVDTDQRSGAHVGDVRQGHF